MPRLSLLPLALALAALSCREAIPDFTADLPRAAPQPLLVASLAGSKAEGVRSWLGIPYARPPVGERRWAPPLPAPRWEGVREATEHGLPCPQPSRRVPVWSEDCLFLNVWAPATAQGLPVLVWIHGGGLLNGAGSSAPYRGELLAARGVVVVTINYRLGALGWLPHEALAGDDPEYPAIGNYGLQDQIMALWWVQEHIAGFGGDPGRVTIFGQSAGGLSVCGLLAAPQAAGLFHGAIIQSGGCAPRAPRADGSVGGGPDALAQGERFAAGANCQDSADTPACLRALPAGKVLETVPGTIALSLRGGTHYGLVVDGHTLPLPPEEAIAQGSAHQVPLMVGATGDEGWLFTRGLEEDEVASLPLAQRLEAMPGGLGLHDIYPPETMGQVGALSAALGDAAFVCGARRVAAKHAAQGNNTWLYHFDYAPPRAREEGVGAVHGAELSYIFGHFALPAHLRLPEQDALHEEIASRWVAFAATGDPRLGPDDPWEPYSAANDQGLLFGPAGGVATVGWRGKECAFWGSLPNPAILR